MAAQTQRAVENFPISGTTLERGHIEALARIKKAAADIEFAAADVLRHENRQVLVAFISFRQEEDVTDKEQVDSKTDGQEKSFLTVDDKMQQYFISLTGELKNVLPNYMVPSIILPVKQMPFMGASMKLDRKVLNAMASKLTSSELASFSLASRVKTAPTTEVELKLRDLWARILGLDVEDIGKNDEFLQIGGDSLTAIELAAKAQEQGLPLTVPNIFRDSRLSAMALATAGGTTYGSLDVKPFELVTTADVQAVASEVQRLGGFAHVQALEDVFPAHMVQEAFMVGTTKNPGTLMAKRVFRLPAHVQVEDFKAAWDKVLDHFPNLRTRIVLHDGKAMQAVLKRRSGWEDATGFATVREFVASRWAMNMVYGTPLSRHAIVREGDENFFVWVHHHAVVDGWTLGLILTALHQFYHGLEPVKLNPFAGFVKFSRSIDVDAASVFWKKLLSGAKQTTWPPVPPAGTPYYGVTEVRSRKVQMPSLMSTSMTFATIMTGAWALALAINDDADDVCFTHTSSGRQAALRGLDTVAGITTARVPVRVRISRSQPISTFLSEIQQQASDAVAHEHFGVANIAKMLPEVAGAVMSPTSLLALQPANQRSAEDASSTDSVNSDGAVVLPAEDKFSSAEMADGFHMAPLVTHCFLGEDNIDLHSNFNTEVVGADEVERLYDQLQRLLLHLARNPNKPVQSAFDA